MTYIRYNQSRNDRVIREQVDKNRKLVADKMITRATLDKTIDLHESAARTDCTTQCYKCN